MLGPILFAAGFVGAFICMGAMVLLASLAPRVHE